MVLHLEGLGVLGVGHGTIKSIRAGMEALWRDAALLEGVGDGLSAAAGCEPSIILAEEVVGMGDDLEGRPFWVEAEEGR